MPKTGENGKKLMFWLRLRLRLTLRLSVLKFFLSAEQNMFVGYYPLEKA